MAVKFSQASTFLDRLWNVKLQKLSLFALLENFGTHLTIAAKNIYLFSARQKLSAQPSKMFFSTKGYLALVINKISVLEKRRAMQCASKNINSQKDNIKLGPDYLFQKYSLYLFAIIIQFNVQWTDKNTEKVFPLTVLGIRAEAPRMPRSAMGELRTVGDRCNKQ